MTIVVALVVLGAAGGWLWWSGALDGLTDRARDWVAVLYPSRPLSRRALPRRLLRAATRTVTVGVSGTTLLPTRIEIAVHPDDLEPFTDALDWLSSDIATALRKKASESGWIVPSGPEIVIVADDERLLRVPRATGHIGALSPDDLRTLRRTDESPALPAGERRAIGPGAGGGAGDGGGGDDPDATRVSLDSNPATSAGHPPGAAPSPPGQPGGPATGGTVPAAPVPAPAGQTSHTVPLALGHTLHLRLVSGDAAEADLSAVLSPQQAPLVLGRSRQCDLRVRDRHASARHCAFSIENGDGALTVEDLGSTNGTFVEGRRIRRTKLRPGEVLRIGDSSWKVALDDVHSTDAGSRR